jgi:hypothetical protein
MRDDPKTLLADIRAVLKAPHVTTRELRGILRELADIAARAPELAGEAGRMATALEDRIRRKAL